MRDVELNSEFPHTKYQPCAMDDPGENKVSCSFIFFWWFYFVKMDLFYFLICFHIQWYKYLGISQEKIRLVVVLFYSHCSGGYDGSDGLEGSDGSEVFVSFGDFNGSADFFRWF